MTATLNKKWNIYCVILIIQALYSLHAWFLWSIPELIATIVIFLFAIFFFLSEPYLWDFGNGRKKAAALLIFILFFYQAIIDGGNFNKYLGQILNSFSLIPLVLLKTKYQIDLLDRFQKVFVVIVGVSLFFWIGHLLGLDLPSVEITYGTAERNGMIDAEYVFDNHFVYLVNQSWTLKQNAIAPDFLRFSSIFIEPGYFSIIMVFLLFINKFNFKDKRNIIYVAAIIASVSLAGFLMAVFSFFANSIQKKRNGFISIIILLFVLILGGSFFKNYNGGHNIINEGIIERLEYDQSSSNITGYNRTSKEADNHFTSFLQTPDVTTGLGRTAVSQMIGNSVGYKVFIMQYGIIGLILFLSYLIIIARIGRNNRSYLLFIIYMLMFTRGHVVIFYQGFMLLYVGGVMLTTIENNIKRYEKNRTRSALQSV